MTTVEGDIPIQSDCPVSPAARRAVLGQTLYHLGGSVGSAHAAAESLAVAKRKLADGQSDRERKGLDDASQVLAHTVEQLARAAAILGRVAHGDPGEACHRQAEHGKYEHGGEG